jgi:hypothetical protein
MYFVSLCPYCVVCNEEQTSVACVEETLGRPASEETRVEQRNGKAKQAKEGKQSKAIPVTGRGGL